MRQRQCTKSCPTLAIPWTVACQAPLSMGFSRQEYWSGLPFPSPGDLPDPGMEPNIRVFSTGSALGIRWSKYWNFRFNIIPSNEFSGLISFRIGWFDLAV